MKAAEKSSPEYKSYKTGIYFIRECLKILFTFMPFIPLGFLWRYLLFIFLNYPVRKNVHNLTFAREIYEQICFI